MEIPGYTIERQIGRGGMATVYLAIQQSLKRHVVLKILDAINREDSEALIQRFLSEGRIIASLNHPNIITIYDIGIAEDMLYISMEYLQGGDLKQRLKSPITPVKALEYLEQIADALGTAHQHDIVHRDVKPANILFKDDDTPVLTDFGIAKQADTDHDLTLTGMFMGSPNYVSPEQADGIKLDGRSDIYSLGCIFYEMLTGTRPFNAETVINIVIQHKMAPIPTLPDELSDYQPLLNQMLAKERQERFHDIASLITEIKALKQRLKPRKSIFDIAGFASGPVSRERRKRGNQLLLGLVLLALVLFSSMKYIEIRLRDTEPKLNKVTTDTVIPDALPSVAINPQLVTREPSYRGAADAGDGTVTGGDAAMPSEEEVLKALQFLGRRCLEDYKLTFPPRDNAYYYYARLLELQPGSQIAIDGILEIAERYAVLAEKSMINNEVKKTAAYIDIGLKINPENQSLLSLKALTESEGSTLTGAFKKLFSR